MNKIRRVLEGSRCFEDRRSMGGGADRPNVFRLAARGQSQLKTYRMTKRPYTRYNFPGPMNPITEFGKPQLLRIEGSYRGEPGGGAGNSD